MVSRHAALEEIREFLHVLKLHESEGILRTKHRCNAKRFEAAIGDILEVPAHICWGKTAHTKAQNVIRERHFRFHSVLQHGRYAPLQIFFEQVRLLLSDRASHFQSKLNMGTLVAEDPVRAGSEAVQQPTRTEKIHVGKGCKKEQTLDATGKADQIHTEIAALLKRPRLH